MTQPFCICALLWLTPITAAVVAQGNPQQVPTMDLADAYHRLSRTTSGPGPADVARLRGASELEWELWLDEQLNPDSITEDPQVASMLQQLNMPPGATTTPPGLVSLRRAQLVFAARSKRQLLEVWVQFQEHHFNTDITQSIIFFAQHNGGNAVEAEQLATRVEWDQNNLFRQHDFGTFRVTLEQVTKGPAELLFLNGFTNTGCFGNENFARELLELMTMGTTYQGNDLPTHPPGTPNYGQVELDGIQRILSGHRFTPVDPPYTTPFTPTFEPTLHCNNPVPVLFANTPFPLTITTTGAAQLTELMDYLAGCPLTREFMVSKFLNIFLGDGASTPGVHDALKASMKAAWGAQGDIRATLRTLFTSNEFRGNTWRWKRASNPFEKVLRPVRVFDMDFGGLAIRTHGLDISVGRIGLPQFEFRSPEGFTTVSLEQLGSSVSIESYLAAGQVYRSMLQTLQPFDVSPVPPVATLVAGLTNIHDPNEVAEMLLNTLYPAAWTATDRLAVVQMLTTPLPCLNGGTSDLNAPLGQAPTFPYEAAFIDGMAMAISVKTHLK